MEKSRKKKKDLKETEIERPDEGAKGVVSDKEKEREDFLHNLRKEVNGKQGKEYPVPESLTQIGSVPGLSKGMTSTRTKAAKRKKKLGIQPKEIRDIEEAEIEEEKEIEPSSEESETSVEESPDGKEPEKISVIGEEIEEEIDYGLAKLITKSKIRRK